MSPTDKTLQDRIGQTTGSLAAENVAAARRDGFVAVKPPLGPRPDWAFRARTDWS